MITVPTGERELLTFANEHIEMCRISVGMRASYCRLMNAIAETGRYDGTKSLINMLTTHLNRTTSHLFSPVELKFSLDFERTYPKNYLQRAAVVAKILTRSWERSNTDHAFALGVFQALKYGACLLKQWCQVEGPDQTPVYYKKLVMPWQFGVYNESENEIDRQPAMVETTTITMPEVWRRIYHLPNAKKLFEKVRSHAMRGQAMSDPQSYFHQVLSASALQTGVQGATRPLPGGIVQLNNDPNYAIMGPQVGAEVVNCHELWVQDDEDYTTIIMIEPDIIIAPFGKKMNLTGVDGLQPYTLIQPNEVANWFWGRSELVDLIEPQALLSTWCDDAKRLFGLQVDRILAFTGGNSIDDEKYGQFRGAGYVSLEQGSDVKDLTPKIFPEMMPMLKFVIEQINWLSGFPDIMQGKGEPGVRAESHASTLMKTASPYLRDRALLVERQVATAADKTLSLKEAKDASKYWVDGTSIETMDKTGFILTDLPEDWRVSVDSHSSSPIFSDENSQLILAGLKLGVVTKEYVMDNLPFPNKEEGKAQVKAQDEAKQAQLQQLIKENPELGEVVAKKQITGGGKR
jgi:hypothetical protein